MSACISREGGYSNHEPGEEFTCARCGVFDEVGALDAIRTERAARQTAEAERDGLRRTVATIEAGQAKSEARAKRAEAERDKYLSAFSEQFDQREEYAAECKRLWPIEERAEQAERREAALRDAVTALADELPAAIHRWQSGAVHPADWLRERIALIESSNDEKEN